MPQLCHTAHMQDNLFTRDIAAHEEAKAKGQGLRYLSDVTSEIIAESWQYRNVSQ